MDLSNVLWLFGGIVVFPLIFGFVLRRWVLNQEEEYLDPSSRALDFWTMEP
jgi:hypothetical protein